MFLLFVQLQTIDEAETQVKVFNAMQQGKDALEKINQEVSVEAVQQLLDESSEAIKYHQVCLG